MIVDDRTLAIRALVRRGVRPIDVAASNAALAESIGHTNQRGNVSQQKPSITSGTALDALRAKRREKLPIE